MYLQPSQREIFRTAQLVLDGDFMAYIYQNSAWAAYDTKNYVVNTNTFTTYPFTIKSPTTPVNATIYGNMVQNGTPTPAAPITPTECGDLETTGEHANQYKIPVSSANTTTNIYLGDVQTTRKIAKLVLDGTETWEKYAPTLPESYLYYLSVLRADVSNCICTHTPYSSAVPNGGNAGVRISDSRAALLLNCGSTTIQNNTKEDFKAWLAAQYAGGTPVTVWYVLETETTGTVNEPIRKIGNYADSVTSSIPVKINSDSVDITTTLKPSAVDAPSLSWSAGDDYKRNSGAWD